MLGLDKRIKAMYGVEFDADGETQTGTPPLTPGTKRSCGSAGVALAVLAILLSAFFYKSLTSKMERSNEELAERVQAIEPLRASNAKLTADLAALQAKVEAIDVTEARLLLARTALAELEQKTEALAAVLDGGKGAARLDGIRAAIGDIRKDMTKK